MNTYNIATPYPIDGKIKSISILFDADVAIHPKNNQIGTFQSELSENEIEALINSTDLELIIIKEENLSEWGI